MVAIKNIEALNLPETEVETLHAGAELHHRHSRITFKVKGKKNKFWIIQVKQDKSPSENHATAAGLVQLTKELFEPHTGPILAHPIPYNEPACNVVTPAWLQNKLLTTKTSIKYLELETGIVKTNLSAWINGNRPMSQPVKAMFFYYFLLKH